MRMTAVVRRAVSGHGRARAPRPPSGWSTGPPDFVGVGAQRAGTTWWYHLVESHPHVVQRKALKELHFLTRYWQRPFTDADVESYAQFFPRPPGQIAGEWSPGYMAHFWVPALLRRAAPDARVLVILRDPVERYRSGLALQSETRRPSFAGASTAFRLGCYASQLAQLYGCFSAEQILVLQQERCVRDPGSELARTYGFLGLDHDFRPHDIAERRNEARTQKPTLPQHSLDSLVAAYEPEVRGVAALVPELDLSLWRNFAHLG
jgi:Sulfotransferase family